MDGQCVSSIHTIKSGDSGEKINESIANCFEISNEFWKDLDFNVFYDDILKLFVRISQISPFNIAPRYVMFFHKIGENFWKIGENFYLQIGEEILTSMDMSKMLIMYHREIGYNENSKKRIYNTMKRILEFSDLYLDTLSLSLLDLAEFPPNEPPNIFLKYAKRDNRFLIKYWQMIGEQSRFRNQIVEYFVNQGMSSEMKYLLYIR